MAQPESFLERLVLPALAAGFLVLAVGMASLIGIEVADQVAAVALLFVGSALTFGVTHLSAETHDRTLLLRVVAAAVLLRLGLAFLFHTQLPQGFFAPDENTYANVGWRLVLHDQGLTPLPWQVEDAWEVGYFYWNAFLFRIFGHATLAPKIANCFIGGWTVLVAYRLAGELAGRGAARRTAVLVALFPSLVLWSTLNIRDTSVVLVLTLLLLVTLRLRLRPSPRRVVALVAALALLSVLRDYMALMAIFAIGGSFLITTRRRFPVNLLLSVGLIGLAIFSYDRLGLGAAWAETSTFEWLSTQRQNLATGGSAFRPETDISTPLQSLQYLPIGLVFFVLAPFPWQIGSLLSLMTLPEMVVWYALLGFVVFGAWHLVRRHFNRSEPVLILALLTTVIYALVEGNAGTAYRHRAQIVVVFLIFAAVGLDEFRRRRRARTSRRTV